MNRARMVCLLMLTHGSTHAWNNLIFKTKRLTTRDLRIIIERVPGYFLISSGLTASLPLFVPHRRRKRDNN